MHLSEHTAEAVWRLAADWTLPEMRTCWGAGMGISNVDTGMLRSIFETLANHYPERMGQVGTPAFVYYASYYMSRKRLRML